MLVCPQCQFENPAQNRFCQQCGSPLKCFRAVLTWENVAIGSGLHEGQGRLPVAAAANVDLPEAENLPDSSSGAFWLQFLTDSRFLDAEKRYQILTPPEAIDPPLADGETGEQELTVLDCLPGAPSPLVQWLETQAADAMQALEAFLPPLAYTHWQLQERFFPVVPELQAAWCDRGSIVTVFEDRNHWASLAEVLSTQAVAPLELIHWLYQIVNLWDEFVAARVEASLLSVDNLCVDDDQILCLKRLMQTPRHQGFTLQNLGEFWRPLLQELPVDQTAMLLPLLAAMAAGEVTEADRVSERLAAIAETIESPDAVSEVIDTAGPEAPAKGMMDIFEMSPPTPTAPDACQEEATEVMAVPPDLPSDVLANLMERLEHEAEEDEEAAANAEDALGDLPTMALPMKLYQVDEVGRTHVGRQRAHNEDSFFAETRLQKLDSPLGTSLAVQGLYILCDGMGGHSGGEVASALAVNSLRDYFRTHWQTALPSPEVIREGILQANQVIFEQNELEARSGNARMGTTLVMVLLTDSQAVVAHVGDSRLYCLTRNEFKQFTVDHEVGQREINRGVEPAIAYARPDAYQLTQALGPRGNQEVVPTITCLPINQDTLFLLCSDGLSDNDLLETHVESHLQPLLRSHADLEEGVANLIDLANEHNGHDNITVIAVRIKVRPNLEALPSALSS